MLHFIKVCFNNTTSGNEFETIRLYTIGWIDNMLFLPWHISYFELFQFCNDYKYITLSDFKGQCYVTW